MVEEYGSAYTIHEGAFLFTPIGQRTLLMDMDEWSEVDRFIADEHYDYDAILKALS